MRIFIFNRDACAVLIGERSDFSQRIKQPFDARLADQIVRGFEREIRGDITVSRCLRFGEGFAEHLPPNFVEFVHYLENKTDASEMQFRDIIFKLQTNF